MKILKLNGKYGIGKLAVIDDEDFERVGNLNWCVNKLGYIVKGIGPRKTNHLIFLHNVIMGRKTGFEIDHINHNPLDNRKNNLRFVTHKQNGMNRRKQSNNTSGYKGVNKHDSKYWRAIIQVDGKPKHLGLFTNIEDAVLAYNKAAKKYFGEYAFLNKI